ncbi:MAG: hypothetical protein GC190_03335 [Alphaproteobacteria bacterium]|nr:hypothetical protein [Alphaproteobacteria bacterium]
MVRMALFGSVAIVICFAAQAHAVTLSDDTIDRAIACSVYGGFASNSDPQTASVRSKIERTIREAVATGQRTQQQVNDAFYDTAYRAMYDQPRAELTANWNECRTTFGSGLPSS